MSETPQNHLTMRQVLDAHAEFGRLDRGMVKAAMGPNWPQVWDGMGDDGIFEARCNKEKDHDC